ncbi:hypothetical protein YC2023_083365 [Brassica napus]
MDTSKPYLHVPFKSEWRDRISYKRVTDAGELVFPDHIESLFSMHVKQRLHLLIPLHMFWVVGEDPVCKRSHLT